MSRHDLFHAFDSNFPQPEQFPDVFEVDVLEDPNTGKVQMKLVDSDRELGDSLTDNAYEDDGYRFHDESRMNFTRDVLTLNVGLRHEFTENYILIVSMGHELHSPDQPTALIGYFGMQFVY